MKHDGIDGIKAVLESGNAQWGLFNRLDTTIYDAVISQATKDNLPSATHTGSAADVKDAVAAGTNSVEHGSMMDDLIQDELFAEMKRKQIAYDPTLSVYEAYADLRTGNPELLNRSLLQQVGPADLLESTRSMLAKGKQGDAAISKPLFERLNQNLLSAYRNGVMLISRQRCGKYARDPWTHCPA